MVQAAVMVASEYEAQLKAMQPDHVDSSSSVDEDNYDSSIFDQLYKSTGNSGVMTLTNFNVTQFSNLFNLIFDYAITN